MGHNKDEGLLAKGFFQHVGGRKRRNWIELALLSFFGRENLEEATLEEIEEVANFRFNLLHEFRLPGSKSSILGGGRTLDQPWSICMVIFCSRHRQTILPEHSPRNLMARQYSSTTSPIRSLSSHFLSLSSMSSLYFVLALFCPCSGPLQIFFYHFTTQCVLSLYDCLHLPPFQFLLKVFGLRFWFDWLWANTSLSRCLVLSFGRKSLFKVQ